MKTWLIIIIFCLSNLIKAQDPAKNLEKYWYYRGRLLDQFVYVPNNYHQAKTIPGACLPAYRRDTIIMELRWGDVGEHLGYYISVLATELALLKEYGQTTSANLTEQELAKALLAVQRIDYIAEVLYKGEPAVNGFFVRDDVPTSGIIADYFNPFGISSDHSRNYQEGEPAVTMSQDHVWNLLNGLVLVKILNATCGTQFIDIVDEYRTTIDLAQDIAYRIVDIMRSKDGIDKVWEIRNPITNECRYEAGQCNLDIYLQTKGFKRVGELISNRDLSWAPAFFLYPESPELEFLYLPSNKTHNDFGRLSLAGIVRDWYAENFGRYMKYIEECGNVHAHAPYAFEHLPLVRQLMYGNPIDFSHDAYYDYYDMKRFIEFLLNTAPPIWGPRYYTEFGIDNLPSDLNRYWVAINRLGKPNRTLPDDDNPSVYEPYSPGHYNGLDYMLLHNLYWLSYINNTPDELNITINFPITYTFKNHIEDEIGTLDRELILEAKNTLEATNWINSGGKIVLHADRINLKPGFKVLEGGYFQAYPNPLNNILYKKLDVYNKAYSSNRGIKSNNILNDFTDQNSVLNSYNTLSLTNILKNSASIGLNDLGDNVSIYPNPTSGLFYITFLGDINNVVAIEIYSLTGQKIVTKIHGIETFNEFDISDWYYGVYLVRITTNDGYVVKRLVKE